jgi:phosphoribosylformimino-5-aminoimidazole carboxamide ribotide isomerase
MHDSTVFSSDPIAMAIHWKNEGARRLHIVDLDGAFAGTPRNGELIRDMVAAMEDVPVQIGGGIRSEQIIENYLDAGAQGLILGTKAVNEPEFLRDAALQHPDKVILGLDVRQGIVATEGWDKDAGISAIDFVAAVVDLPLAGIVYTDIDRDGMMQGLNVEATLALAKAANTPVVASGGVTTIEDLRALKQAFAEHPALLMGAITGRAIYEGTLDVAAGQALLDD